MYLSYTENKDDLSFLLSSPPAAVFPLLSPAVANQSPAPSAAHIRMHSIIIGDRALAGDPFEYFIQSDMHK